MRPHPRGTWVDDHNVALLTDLYELTMTQAYWLEGMADDAVFTLFVRRLPAERSYLLACGLDDALAYLESFHFSAESLDWLRGRHGFDPSFIAWLSDLRFTGDVRAVPEGTPVFANEPLLEVRAPLPQAQLVETFLLNQIHLQTTLASKAARVVQAAGGRPVVDFGLRRVHGADAGLKAARAFHIAGAAGTSNVLAGKTYGVPVLGTMAHSYIQAHRSEEAAFRAFVGHYPETVMLVDTYDTLEGVRKVIALAGELGDDFRVRALRLDSGDLAELARETRGMLDRAGLGGVEIFASSGLDEHSIARLLADGAPIDGFGVGGAMGVPADAPSLDMVYKLVEYAGRGRLKLSADKPILPGAKQVWRRMEDGVAVGDVIGRADEALDGEPLLRTVMRAGRRLEGARDSLDDARARAAAAIAALPGRLRSLEPVDPAYPVDVSPALAALQAGLAQEVTS